MQPAAISARPASTTTRVGTCAPERPAASAKGTVRPSDIPITMSRTVSVDFKWCSAWGPIGIWFGIAGEELSKRGENGLVCYNFSYAKLALLPNSIRPLHEVADL